MPTKKIIFTLLFSFFVLSSFAQELFYQVTFLDKNLKPITNTQITCTETETRKVIHKKTDKKGTAEFHFTEGKLWQMDLLKIKNYYLWQLKMPKKGVQKRKQTITYDFSEYLRAMRPPIDRSKINFKIIKQKISNTEKPTTESIIKIVLTKADYKTKIKIPVAIQLTCYKTKTQYQSITNLHGTVFFKVPIGQDYDIDIEGIEGYDVISISNKGAGIYKNTFTFEPINFKETIKNNIVSQKLAKKPTPTSGRFLLKAYFVTSGGEPMPNQEVILEELQGKLKYKTTTDENSGAYFMLPKKKTYVYSYPNQGPFKDNEEVVDLTRSQGIAQGQIVIKLRKPVELRNTKLKLTLLKTNNEITKFFNSDFSITNFSNKSIPYYTQSYLFYQDKEKTNGLEKGLMMTSGNVLNSIGPNDTPMKSGANAYYIFDKEPTTLKNDEPAFDPCIIEFDLTTHKNKKELYFEYVFASEEYPEYTEFDDAFGAFISGGNFSGKENFANFGGEKRLSVSYLNAEKNSQNYIENDSIRNPVLYKTWQYDGFSKILTKKLTVVPEKTYHIKFIIFDRKDNIYDSAVFINIK